ncbi:hypothetical protein DENSPDRAFT_926975 [Dentipellis sp. KUC8613]|nr:hypothetical protein DENSPDRAFT_926975 [Dentipellis sp. KUC8613]
MPPSVYPLPWLEGTFYSRARTEALLRPELENGTITPHDFNAAVDFYPRSHRHWPIAGMFIGGAGALLFERAFRRPKLNLGRWGALGMFSSFTGLVVGQIKRAQAHRDFVTSLENRTGFFRALENVNARTGGRRPLGLPTEDSHESKHAPAPAPTPASVPRRVPPIATVDHSVSEPVPEAFSETWREDGRDAIPDPPVSEPSEPAAEAREDHPRSRWDEIRIANTRGTQQTSWDKLRQGRPAAPRVTVQKVEEQAPASASAEAEAERAREQAKFDAMLEAERHIAEKSSPSDAWK